jgi:hypothetical protein
VIARGSRRMFAETEVVEIQAWIKPENEASRRAFWLAGYRLPPEGHAAVAPAAPAELLRLTRPARA